MNIRLIPLALLGAAALAAPLLAKPATHAAKPAPYAAWLADPLRNEDMRKLDEGRMPAAVLARAVGPKGKVFAANPPGEHNPKAWEPLAGKVPQLHVMVAEIPQMQFAPRSLDVIFTNLNYHDLYWESEKYHFPRVEVPTVLAAWFTQLKPGGQVVIIDHAGSAGGDPREVADRLHRIDPERVKADMTAAGFVFESASNLLRRSEDDHSKLVFDPAVRGKTDRFILKFRRP